MAPTRHRTSPSPPCRHFQSSPALAGKTPSSFADNDAYALAIMMGLIETTTTRLDMHDLVRPPSLRLLLLLLLQLQPAACLPRGYKPTPARHPLRPLSLSSRLYSCRFSFRKLQISRRGSRRIRRVPCDISRKLCFCPRPRLLLCPRPFLPSPLCPELLT